MKKLKTYLFIAIFISIIIPIISIVVVIPNTLKPIYEKDIYNVLNKNNRVFFEDDTIDNIAQIIISNDTIKISSNFDEVTEVSLEEIIPLFLEEKGKINIQGEDIYYVRNDFLNNSKITFTNGSYIKISNNNIIIILLPLFTISILCILFALYFFNKKLISSFTFLNNKIMNIDNDKYNHNLVFEENDNIGNVERTIEKIRINLKEKEEYKQNLFQNISHDLKTPVMVIKSYVEAMSDGKVDESGLKVINKQTDILQDKVSKILYLNKIDYYSSINENFDDIKLKNIIKRVVENQKDVNKDISFNLDLDDSLFYGKEDLYEIVISNIIENFLRYAETEINIKLKDNKLTMYNDGKNIDNKLIEKIFVPYEKGNDGKFGLGLSIVKNTLDLFSYNVRIENLEKGVQFIIE